MDLALQYERQYTWRSWAAAYAALPSLAGTRVLDLGCSIGDQARDLAARGARVVGIDADARLLAVARARGIPGAVFHVGDVREPDVQGPFDGVWASFVAAYFPDLEPVLRTWRTLLRPGGWIALTEVDGLFAHAPLPENVRLLLQAYEREAFDAGWYDFNMGHRLGEALSAAGFEGVSHHVLVDRELSFKGCADGDVLQAWGRRLERMRLLQERACVAQVPLQEALLACLTSPAHTTACQVHFWLARSTRAP
jgi:SAM-dependent methyltransferase